jgi:hypothetical protein
MIGRQEIERRWLSLEFWNYTAQIHVHSVTTNLACSVLHKEATKILKSKGILKYELDYGALYTLQRQIFVDTAI